MTEATNPRTTTRMKHARTGLDPLPLIFERSKEGRGHQYLPHEELTADLDKVPRRENPPGLPQISEIELGRHYTALETRTHGINNGPILLGSCTMKYNPRLNERTAAMPAFTGLHPLQAPETCQGALAVYHEAAKRLTAITGMDKMTFQPAAGSHGEFTGLLLIRAYHEDKDGGETLRNEILIPDAAHGTNPASATMAGFKTVSIPSHEDGSIDVDALRELVSERTAGLMLTNPDTEGRFEPQVETITSIVHEAGGLCYYDGANLNAIMGVAEPGVMGFDVIHLNLHKTFSTPHGGGGPGACAVGVKEILAPYLPEGVVEAQEDGLLHLVRPAKSIGRVRSFTGNFLVVLRALTYLLVLGKEGVRASAEMAVLNANYVKAELEDLYPTSHDGLCMHEFVMTLTRLKHDHDVTAADVAKALHDYGIHPPTMYFPLTVPEALMVEPTETESPESLARIIEAFREIHAQALEDPEVLKRVPCTTPVSRPDEAEAARHPKLVWQPDTDEHEDKDEA